MMTPPRSPSRSRAGFSLVELLVTLVVLSLIMGTTVMFFQNQNKAFIAGGEKMDTYQNARYAISQVERIVRTMGAGVTGQQPMLVYGGNDVLAFNTDYTENDTTNYRWAVNFNPSINGRFTQAWDVSAAQAIPNTTYTYPPQTFTQPNGSPAPAETKIYFFVPDSSTARTDDYMLMEQSNYGTPEYIARNILAYPGRPFFEYIMARRLSTGTDTMVTATGSLLPLKRVVLAAGFTATDTANALRPDSVREVRINIRVTNGKLGTDERTRDFSQIIQVPNNGLPSPNVCGRSPFPPASFTATPNPTPGSGVIRLDWTRSPDHGGGEYDVRQYVLWQRDDTATVWQDPLMMVRADTTTAYSVLIGGLNPGQTYKFGVAAQDCTPAESSILMLQSTATP